jgi:hypothetical protein
MPVVALEFLRGVVFILEEVGVLADTALQDGVTAAPPAPARGVFTPEVLLGVLITGGADCRPQEFEAKVSEELREALSIS